MLDRGALDKAVENVRAGNRDAYREIVSSTAVVLRAYVSFFIDDPVVVDDVLQDVYVDAYENLGDYTVGTDFMAWIKTKARLGALAARRRMGRERDARRRYAREVDRVIAEKAEEREKAHPLEGKLAALTKCLESLTERIRNLVKMKYFSGLDLNAIAQASNMTPVAVGTALHRARAALAKCVEGTGEQT